MYVSHCHLCAGGKWHTPNAAAASLLSHSATLSAAAQPPPTRQCLDLMPPCGLRVLVVVQVEEDPDHEFPPTTADDPPLSGPRLIEVGIKGPGAHPTLWRRAWRDKILPAVVNFNPDLIMVSAGFDAHRKDVINYR